VVEQWQRHWISCCHPASNNIEYLFNDYPAVEWQQAEEQNDNPELTASSFIGSSMAGWTRII